MCALACVIRDILKIKSQHVFPSMHLCVFIDKQAHTKNMYLNIPIGMNVGSHHNNAIANSNKTRLLVWLTY